MMLYLCKKRHSKMADNFKCVYSMCLFSGFFFPIACGGERGLVVGCWICTLEVPVSNPPPCHWMDLSLVAPNSTPPRCVSSQLVSLPPVGILTLLCLICIIFVCYVHLNIFTWNLRDINVYFIFFYFYS